LRACLRWGEIELAPETGECYYWKGGCPKRHFLKGTGVFLHAGQRMGRVFFPECSEGEKRGGDLASIQRGFAGKLGGRSFLQRDAMVVGGEMNLKIRSKESARGLVV